MASLASRIGNFIPDSTVKNQLRTIGFKLLFTTSGLHKVKLGTDSDKITAVIHRLIFTRESTGSREISGYLQYYHPKPGDFIVNAGAYHGYFAIYLSRKVGPQGRILCFEPEPNNFRLLQKNILANNLKNVTLVPKGLWSSNTALPIIPMGSGSTITPSPSYAHRTVPVCTLDSELTRLGIKKVNLITMDIEGAEIEALKGAMSTIIKNPNINLAVASYHKVNGYKTSSQVEMILRKCKLFVRTSYPRHLTTYARYYKPFTNHVHKISS